MSDRAVDRRHLLKLASAALVAAPSAALPVSAMAPGPANELGPSGAVSPLPLADVRLEPSIYLDAVEANLRYVLSLEPERLLHNFYQSAGLPTKGPVYGGWEARGIAGHTLGHYLSACSLLSAQTGNHEVSLRLDETLAALAACQRAHGDGYLGGTTVERDGEVIDGKIVFEEIRRGEIRTGGFDINGGWVPLYTWHKVQAGLIDAIVHGGKRDTAFPILVGMADYLEGVLAGLSHDQMQRLLAAEHGGLNEAFANTYALTGNKKYLRLAERIYHEAVLEPLRMGRDELAGLHANTQIPKLVGLARLAELNGSRTMADTAAFFYRTVTEDHSYAIGGNSEREHFGLPGQTTERLTDRTCEACNTYNMLKLARHLYARAPDARWFDEFEHAHLNHIMAHQDPETGMFVYFMPMSSGARRTYSQPEDSFWCCVGSGIESHAKHGDSIYWEGSDELYVNLFVPSRVRWRNGGLGLTLTTAYPQESTIRLRIDEAPDAPRTLKLRIPSFSAETTIRINGEDALFETADGYAVLTRRWEQGDEIVLTVSMSLGSTVSDSDQRYATFRYGPLVLAADLGSAGGLYNELPPAIVRGGGGELGSVAAKGSGIAFQLNDTKPEPVTLVPFFNLYDRRTAVYFPLFTEREWEKTKATFRADQQAAAELARRTVDVIHLGEMQPERDHNFASNQSDVVAFGGRNGRQAWWGVGNYIAFDLATTTGPMILRVLYWGEEVDKDFSVYVDDTKIADERRPGPPKPEFVAVDYPLPDRLTENKESVRVRFETNGTDAPVYEARILRG